MTLRKKNVNFVAAMSVAALMIAQAAGAAEIARVNDKPISDKDLRAALAGLNEGQRDSVLKDVNSRRQVLSSLIDQEVLVAEATKEKLDQDAEFKEAQEAFRKQYLANKVLQKNLSNKFTDSAVKKYYDSHKSRYSTDQVHAQHILVSDEQKAQEMIRAAKAKDADFEKLAEQNSKDPSAKNNRGDLGFFGRDRMVPEFTEAAFAAAEGAVVGPVKTAYGYHVIKVIKKRMGTVLELSDVEGRVRNELRQDLTQEYVGKLKKQAKIQVNDQTLDKL